MQQITQKQVMEILHSSDTVKVSVIVCCYNSALVINETLDCTFRQDAPNLCYEIIVVDNRSTDDTSRVVQEKLNLMPQQLGRKGKLIYESQPGLSHARRAGVRVALGEVVVFCDDDNRLDERYIATAWSIMEANATVGILGGMGIADLEVEEPDWWPLFKKSYAIGAQAETNGRVTRGYVYGAGMVIRKSVFESIEKFGFYSLLADRKGNELSSGGDVELCMLAELLGFEVHYDDRLIFCHRISSTRLTWDYYRKLKSGISDSFMVVFVYRFFIMAPNKNFLHFIKAWLKRIRRSLQVLRLPASENFKENEISVMVERKTLSQLWMIRRNLYLFFEIRRRYNAVNRR